MHNAILDTYDEPCNVNTRRLEDSRRFHITAYTVPTTLLALTVNQKRTLTGSKTLSGVESTVHHLGEVATEDRILDVGV